jgi:hypothetical protein
VAFVLQLRKKHGKTSVRVVGELDYYNHNDLSSGHTKLHACDSRLVLTGVFLYFVAANGVVLAF